MIKKCCFTAILISGKSKCQGFAFRNRVFICFNMIFPSLSQTRMSYSPFIICMFSGSISICHMMNCYLRRIIFSQSKLIPRSCSPRRSRACEPALRCGSRRPRRIFAGPRSTLPCMSANSAITGDMYSSVSVTADLSPSPLMR